MNANNPSSPAAGTHKDFIVFILDGAHYALPAEAVAEVIDKQPVTPVPFMPLHVEGVVNIGGRALPQLDLRSCLSDQAVGTRDDYELMVVESDGAPCVLAVDRVLSRVEVPAETVREVAEPEGATTVKHLMQSEFLWNGNTIISLDVRRFAALFTTASVESGQPGMLGLERTGGHSERHDAQKFIIIRDGSEHYGVLVSQVCEIVEMDLITRVPSTPLEVVGIGMLRHDPVLVLSLHTLLHGEPSPRRTGSILVVERDTARYGLLVDEIEGILELPEASVRRTVDGHGLAGILIDESGQLDGWLDIRGLIDDQRARELQAFTPVVQSIQARRDEAYRQMLQVAIGGETFGLPLDSVRRVMEFSGAEPVRDPSRPWLVGVIDVDGDVVAVTDLARDLGQDAGTADGPVVIVGEAGCECALKVRRVDRIMAVPEDCIEAIPESDGGYVSEVAVCDGEMISVLDLTRMFDSVRDALEIRG